MKCESKMRAKLVALVALVSLSLVSLQLPSTLAQPSPAQVVFAQAGDPPSMDPHKARGAFGGNVLFNLFEGLTRTSADGRLLPALATSWRSVDEKTWQFTLRRGVRFHNGAAFTADAVEFNFKRLFEPGKPRLNTTFRGIDRIDVIDKYTVNVISKGASPSLPEAMSELLISEPEHTNRVGEEGMSKTPVGTGPYRLVDWKANQEVVFEAFPEYWRGKARVERLVFRTIPEPTTRIAELLTARVDIIQDVPPEQIPVLRANPRLGVETRPSKRTVYVGINLLEWGPKEVKDRRVRQALNHAVDVETINRTVYAGLGRRNETVFRTDYFGYDSSISAYEYDPKKAKELLAAAGYANGFEIGFLTSEGIILKGVELAEAVAGYLRRVGIQVTVKPVSLATIRSVIVGGQEQRKNEGLFLSNYGSSLSNPDIPLTGFLHTNQGTNSYYANKELDALIEKARVTLKLEERARIYREIQLLLKREAPVIFLFQAPDIWGVNRRVDWKSRNDQNILGYDMSLR